MTKPSITMTLLFAICGYSPLAAANDSCQSLTDLQMLVLEAEHPGYCSSLKDAGQRLGQAVQAATPTPTLSKKVTESAHAAILNQINGSQSSDASNLTLDVLPRIIAQVSNLTDTVELAGNNDKKGESIDLALNLPFCANGLEGNCAQLAIDLASDPVVSPMLLEAIPEADRSAFESSSNASLNSTDDVEIRFTYNLQGRIGTRYWGRNIDLYKKQLAGIKQIFDAASTVRAMQQLSSETGGNTTALRQALNLGRLQTLENQQIESSDKSLTDIVSELIGNQPQFSVAAAHRSRDDLIGQNETRVSITYEQPWGMNLNRFLGNAGQSCVSSINSIANPTGQSSASPT